MTVEEIRGDCENFPMGLRVLAVDDDPVCLKLLETLLRKCQYHVTTTSQARIALKMLRENKNIFDLVISDVHMPDMDGFKLLELVGLEMDLPVIMLSANGDPKLVMKGVTHGACDYLVKPVRIEELRNIWQHVIRRKKVDPKNQVKGEIEGQGSPLTGNADGKFNRKRKDEEDESVENGNESEDPGTQKKPRVVWSIELHRKFVMAVKQLGIEKAVPKRILDLMNVEGLTRENVASHLQKYRLYLKRISSVQQTNMISALGVKDNPFMHMGSLDGLENFHVLSGPRLSNITLSSSFASNGMNLRNLAPTTLIQPNHSQNLTNSISPLGKMHHILPSANQNASHLFQGMPLPFELSQLQPNNIDSSRSFANAASFRDLGETRRSNLLSNSNCNIANNAPQVLDFGELRNHAPHEISSFGQESFNPGPSCLHQNGTTTTTNNNNSNILLPDENCSNNAFFSSDPIGLSSGMALVTSEPRQDYAQGGLRNNNVGTLNGIVSRLGQNSEMLNQKMDILVNGSSFLGNNVSEKAGVELGMRSNENVLMEQPRAQARFVQQSYDSLDELMNVMIKREQDERIPDFDFGVDDYSFGQGM